MSPNNIDPREFLLAHSIELSRMMRDATSLSAGEFSKRHRIAVDKARVLISRFREVCSLPERQDEATALARQLAGLLALKRPG